MREVVDEEDCERNKKQCPGDVLVAHGSSLDPSRLARQTLKPLVNRGDVRGLGKIWHGSQTQTGGV
jgi:hypothetical protein